MSTTNRAQRAHLIHKLRSGLRDHEQVAALRAEAAKWLSDTQAMRRERLTNLREMRRAARESFAEPARRIRAQKIVRPYVRPQAAPRLHPEALYNEAARLFAYAGSPLPGAPFCNGTYVMDDGYSLCGLADAHAAEREDAGEYAALLTMAALMLDHRIN